MFDFSKCTLTDLFRFLEDTEQNASLEGLTLRESLEKKRMSKRIPKDICTVLINTAVALEKGDISVDGKTYVIENEELPSPTGRLIGPDENINISSSKSSKELGAWLMDRTEWSVVKVNAETGAEFTGKESSDRFSYRVNDGLLVIGDRRYVFRKDFDCLAYERGDILVLRKWYDETLYEVIDEVHYNNGRENESA